MLRINTNRFAHICSITLLALGFTISLAEHASARSKFIDIQTITTDTGIEAWLVEDKTVPIIALNFAFAGTGTALDNPEKQGLTRLASNMLDEGAGDLKSQEFQKRLRDSSISLSFGASRDAFTGSLKTLSVNKAEAFNLLKLALTAPRFDAEPLQRMRTANQSRIRSSLANPEWMAARILNDQAFSGHSYALNSGGTLSSLENITADDLRNLVKTRFARKNLKISVVGDITARELKTTLDTIFSHLPENNNLREIEDINLQNENSIILYEQDHMPQTIIEIVQEGIDRKDPDYHAAQIMNYILGGAGFGSRLMEEIREKRGLTYGIYTYFQEMDHFNGFRVSTSTQNKNVEEMLERTRHEFANMKTQAVTQKELDDAKTYLIGSLPLSLTSTNKISALLLSLQMNDLGPDYLDKRAEELRAVTIEDVKRVTKRILAPETFLTILVGNPENITPTKKIEALPNAK